MWIKRSLLESRPEEILKELKDTGNELNKAESSLKGVRLSRGGYLSQENQIKQELGSVKAQMSGTNVGVKVLEARAAGLQAQLDKLLEAHQPEKEKLNKQEEELETKRKNLKERMKELKRELNEYIRIG